MDSSTVKGVIEAALLVADGPLTAEQCVKLFKRGEITREEARELVKAALEELEVDCAERGIELKKVASGYRFQVRQELSPWVSRLWDEKPPRYSRALLETLALVAYRQPATRGDIEQVRGVAVSQNIMRTLVERGWIKDVGHREVPGRPTMYGTTKAFLDYFNLKSLNQLPPLEEIRELVEPMVVAETGEELVPGAAVAPTDGADIDTDDDELAAARSTDAGLEPAAELESDEDADDSVAADVEVDESTPASDIEVVAEESESLASTDLETSAAQDEAENAGGEDQQASGTDGEAQGVVLADPSSSGGDRVESVTFDSDLEQSSTGIAAAVQSGSALSDEELGQDTLTSADIVPLKRNPQ